MSGTLVPTVSPDHNQHVNSELIQIILFTAVCHEITKLRLYEVRQHEVVLCSEVQCLLPLRTQLRREAMYCYNLEDGMVWFDLICYFMILYDMI